MSDLASRFRGFLPVVIDVESGGINPATDALLELAAITLKMEEDGSLVPDQTYHYHILPFENANLDPEALAFNKIEPLHPLRFAIDEKEALTDLFTHIQEECKQKNCTRAVVVGHNAWFDLHFLNAAIDRSKFKSTPFHRFTSFDTATLSALVYGQTVLSKALQAANIEFKSHEAHSALYDAQATATLFCKIVETWRKERKFP